MVPPTFENDLIDRFGIMVDRPRPLKRSYVACISCRSRKVKCVMGDEPPCAKCRREHRDCLFGNRNAPTTTNKHRQLPKWVKQTDTTPSSASSERAGQASNAVTADQSTRGHPETPNDAGTLDPLLSQHQSSPGSQSLLSDGVVASIITGSNDALDILSNAANHLNAMPTPSSSLAHESPATTYVGPTISPTAIAIPPNSLGFTIDTLSEPSDAVLDLWDRSRLVRQGLFTAQEAVTYVDLFFKYLSPLTPVVLDQFRDHSGHSKLVTEEALLCCTILAISSRFFQLPGAGGASRSHFIHLRVWGFCEHLIKRITFGQEKESSSKTRCLGTIESLILISDWHPRSLHFPPDTEGWDALLISPDYDSQNRRRRQTEEPLIRWRHDVFEPAKRATRMTWMLLGMAKNLAYELGIMSNIDPKTDEDYRSIRAQKLIYMYTTQLANKLSYPSVFPESIAVNASRPISDHTVGGLAYEGWASYVDASMDLLRLSRTASSLFFQSADHLQSQLLGDHYLDLLEHFTLSATGWERAFEASNQKMTSHLRDSLSIEFHHLKACASAISIQAVVNRAIGPSKPSPGGGTTTNNAAITACVTARDARFIRDVITDSTRVLAIATTPSFLSQLPFTPARTRISIISASLFLLKAVAIVAAGSRQGTHCKSDPSDRNVVVSGAEIHRALDTLDDCTRALNRAPADDVDFAMRYAALIEKKAQTARLRANLASGSMSSQHPSEGVQRPVTRPRRQPQQGPTPSTELEGGGYLEGEGFFGQQQKEYSDDQVRDGDAGLGTPSAGKDSMDTECEPQGSGHGGEFDINAFDFGGLEATVAADDWSIPMLDSSIAPFGSTAEQLSVGFHEDSLDFLFDLPNTS